MKNKKQIEVTLFISKENGTKISSRNIEDVSDDLEALFRGDDFCRGLSHWNFNGLTIDYSQDEPKQ